MNEDQNENLNAAEKPDYHILLDWGEKPCWAPMTTGPVSGTVQDPSLHWLARCHSGLAGVIDNGRMTCNGHFVWGRLRDVMSKFVTGVKAMADFARGEGKFHMTIHSPLGSVRPGNG